jgi:hypothetical protein
MMDPRRLVDEEVTPIERALLRAGIDERPSKRGIHRTMVALGVGGGVLTTASASGAVGVGSKLLLGGVVKWLAVALLTGGVTLGTWYSLGRGRQQPTAHRHEQADQQKPTQRHGSLQTVLDRKSETPKPADVLDPRAPIAPEPAGAANSEAVKPIEPKAAKASRPVSHAVSEDPDLRSSLAEQVALMDEARRALARGDAASALSISDRYEQKFPGGSLVQEATLLRIEALAQQGDRAAAAAVARRFLAAHPDSPHSKRIRSLLGDAL